MRSTAATRTPVDFHRFMRVCRLLDEQPDVNALLRYIADLALEFGPADHAVVDVVRRGVLSVAVATSEVAGEFEAAQVAEAAGPAPAVGRGGAAGAGVADWAQEERWPALVRLARALGIRSQRSYPLIGRRGTIGVVSIYAAESGAFGTGTDGAVADDLSEVLVPCGIAYAAAQLEEDLRRALSSRDTIGQAKGILMERLKVGPDEAFGLLVSVSQRSHRKLHEVAEDVTRTGQLDDVL